jgi:hypothetical protein
VQFKYRELHPKRLYEGKLESEKNADFRPLFLPGFAQLHKTIFTQGRTGGAACSIFIDIKGEERLGKVEG